MDLEHSLNLRRRPTAVDSCSNPSAIPNASSPSAFHSARQRSSCLAGGQGLQGGPCPGASGT